MGVRRLMHSGRVMALAAVLLVGAWLAGSGSALRQTQTPPRKEAGRSDDPSERPWHLTFEDLFHNDATGEGEATMVVATSDQDTRVQADRFRWNDKTRKAWASGNLSMKDERTEGTADQVEIDYAAKRRLMVLTGNVKLVLKPRRQQSETGPSGGNGEAESKETTPAEDEENNPLAGVRDYPIEVTCDRAEYEYARDKRHAVLTGNFRAVQKLRDFTRTLTAEKAEWFGREERLVLRGPVKLEDTKGRKGETPEDVEIFTAEGKEGIKLRKGTYVMPVEERSETAAPPAEPAKGNTGTGKPEGGK